MEYFSEVAISLMLVSVVLSLGYIRKDLAKIQRTLTEISRKCTDQQNRQLANQAMPTIESVNNEN